MRSTGIVRRMDELGRVVIPKELRRTLKIREGEELEVLTSDENELILRKYSAIEELADFKADYVRSIYTTTGLTALITDNDRVLAVSGKNPPARSGDPMGANADELLNLRKCFTVGEKELGKLFKQPRESASGVCAPIVNGGSVLGSVMVFGAPLSESLAQKTAETAADFISKRI